MKNKKYLLGGLLLLGIGFAAVSTTLYINGTVNIKADVQNFEENVKFNTVTVDSESSAAGTTSEISADGKTITVTTHNLTSIGEKVEVAYTIENQSQYDAEIGELTCTSEDANWSTYISLTEHNSLNGTTLVKTATSSSDKIEIEMIRSYAGTETADEQEFTFNCNLPVSAKEVQ